MRVVKKKIPRKFLVSEKNNIILKDVGKVFLNNNENPIIIKIDKIAFLKISLDSFILILVPKNCPNNAGRVTKKLINKS